MLLATAPLGNTNQSHSLCWIEERSGKYCQGREETETYTLVVAAENGVADAKQ